MGLAIVGLGYLGTALGLAIKSAIPDLEITGHDPDPQLASLAKKRGAIDKSHWNLSAACAQADIVLVDQSFEQLETTLQVLGETLAENALVIDLSLAKRAGLTLASRLLPASIRYIEAYLVPGVNAVPELEPSKDSLQDATFYLAASQDTNESALQTASGLAAAIGASTCFVAPDELDSLIASGNHVPFMTAMALMATWQQTPGWQDRKNALGMPAHWVWQILDSLSDKPEAAIWQNRDMVKDWLGRLITNLHSWQALLEKDTSADLDGAVNRLEQALHEKPGPSQPEGALENDDKTGIRQLFLGSIGRRMKGKR